TVREEELLHALKSLTRKYNSLKATAISLQSALVLNSMYCDRLRSQLEAQEEAKKRVSKARLMGDGMPRLLTSEEFVGRVEEFAKETEEKERAQKERQANKNEIAEARRKWEELENARVKENERLHDLWEADKELWK
ncbi:hypothetical protein K435DRAFT_599326, partial [Dendrothele bispora CBS 962.96]